MYALAGVGGVLLAWALWFAWDARRLLREAFSVAAALAEPASIGFVWRERPHLLFRFGPGAAAVAELEAVGFRVVGYLDEQAGLAILPVAVLIAPDQTARAAVWLWRFLPLGLLRAQTSFLSETEAGDLVITSAAGLPSGGGVVAMRHDGPLTERWVRHQAFVGQQASLATPLEPTRPAMDALVRRLYQVTAARTEAAPPDVGSVLPGVVDGREAAREAGLKVGLDDGVGTISGATVRRIAIGLVVLALGCAGAIYAAGVLTARWFLG